jgi:hypothetical protein
MERRFLTRIECVAFNRRYQVDLRTSDWPAKIVSSLRRVIPHQWRGTKRTRELREYLINYMKRMIAGAGEEYDRWIEPAGRLHHYAAEGRLQGAAVAEIKMLIDSASSTPPAVAVVPFVGDAG